MCFLYFAYTKVIDLFLVFKSIPVLVSSSQRDKYVGPLIYL